MINKNNKNDNNNNINDDKLEDDPQPLFQTQRKETL